MKLFFALIVIAFISTIFYLLSAKFFTAKNKKTRKPAILTTIFALSLVILLTLALYRGAIAPDNWCSSFHTTNSAPPQNLKTSMDYFEQGNYDYDKGDCSQAIVDYTKSISLNSKYAQSYNNRGYTYMRLRDYQNALPDLNKAISLNPTYVQALMNRGDIYNFYYSIDRSKAIADYQKVISLGFTSDNSVCGHLLLAKHGGWNLGTILDFLKGPLRNCH